MEGFTLKSKSALVSKSGGGKSCLLKYILSSERSQFDKIYVISGTESMNGFYSTLVEKECIFTEYNEDWLKKLIKKLKEYKEKNSKPYNVLIVFDDLGYNENFRKSKCLVELACQGRHYNCFFTCLLQYIYQIPPTIRNNINFILCGQSNQRSVDILCEEFLYSTLTRKDFINMYHNATREHGFLLIKTDCVKDDSDPNSIYGVVRCPSQFL